MPKSIRDAAENAGATVKNCPGEELYMIRLTHGSGAWDVIDEWVSGLPEDSDPAVTAFFAPSANIFNTPLCPAGSRDEHSK